MTPMKTTQRLLEHYNTYTQRPDPQDPALRKTMFRSLSRIVGPWLPPDKAAAILDVACGEGALLGYLAGLGYTNLAGFDLSPENVNICHTLGLAFVREFDALQLGRFMERKFDVIFAMDIIEHLPKQELSQFLEQVRGRLMPGGYVVIQTPNMGSILAAFVRYNDLSHELGLTERTAVSLLLTAGFSRQNIEVRPAWYATSALGHLREAYLGIVHRMVFLAEDSGRPRIPTKNLLIRARV